MSLLLAIPFSDRARILVAIRIDSTAHQSTLELMGRARNSKLLSDLVTSNQKQLMTNLSDERLDEAGSPVAPALQRRGRFEAVLSDLSATFVNLPANQVDSQIESALQKLVELLGIDRVGLSQMSADGSQFVVTHSYQLPEIPPSAQIIVTSQLPTFAKMVQQGKVVRVPDDLPAEATLERHYYQRIGLRSNLSIPLTMMGKVVGGIGFSSFRSPRAVSDELIPRLRLVGDIFTNALARKRADEQLQANDQTLRQSQLRLEHLAAKLLDAQEEERRRIAREMHDDWAQRLAVLGIEAEKLNGHLDATDEGQALLAGIQDGLVRLSEVMHDRSRQLHPSILDELGLVEALKSECASFGKQHGITIDYSGTGVPANISGNIPLEIYRVAQEGLRNIAKHAGVGTASVSLETIWPQLRLLIRDQGSGFDLEEIRLKNGLGLSSMEERVRLIGGEISIESAPGQGTEIDVRIPLAENTT